MKRTSLDVIEDILRLTEKGPIRKTVLMFKAQVSYARLQSLLAFLLERGFIEVTKEPPKQLRITNKGRRYLQAWQDIKGFYKAGSIAEALAEVDSQ
jgi:predicted transcriptional regulator